MTHYDVRVIQAHAEQLYRQASTTVISHVFVLGIIGAAAGRALEHEEGVLIGLGLVGAVIGYFVGSNKAFLLRLRAQTALCQAQIESNTRQGSGGSNNGGVSQEQIGAGPSRKPQEKHAADIGSAIFSDDMETVRRILAEGYDVNAANEYGVTPLQMARNCDRREILRLLEDAGARK